MYNWKKGRRKLIMRKSSAEIRENIDEMLAKGAAKWNTLN